LLSGGLGLCATENLGGGIPTALIGALLASIARVVRFVFDNEALEVRRKEEGGGSQNDHDHWAPP